MDISDIIQLLMRLIAIPSISKEESVKADFLQEYWQKRGWNVQRMGITI